MREGEENTVEKEAERGSGEAWARRTRIVGAMQSAAGGGVSRGENDPVLYSGEE